MDNICNRCNGEGHITVHSGDPALPDDLIECPDCKGRQLTKKQMRQLSRDNAPPADSPPDVARLYR